MHPENQLCQMRSLVRDVVQIDDQRQDQENHCVDGQHGQIRPLEQFLGIEPGAFKVLGTDTLTDHGDHAHPDGLGWQNLKGGHGVADGICRDGGGAKSRDDAEQHDLSQMKETALKTAGHAQLQYCFDDMSLQAAAERLADMEGIFFIAQEPDHGDSADDSRSQGRDGNAFYTHVETEDQKGVAPYIDDVHADGNPHGDRGVAHDAEEGGAGVVESDKGNRGFYDDEIGISVIHNLLVDVAKESVEDEILCYI